MTVWNCRTLLFLSFFNFSSFLMWAKSLVSNWVGSALNIFLSCSSSLLLSISPSLPSRLLLLFFRSLTPHLQVNLRLNTKSLSYLWFFPSKMLFHVDMFWVISVCNIWVLLLLNSNKVSNVCLKPCYTPLKPLNWTMKTNSLNLVVSDWKWEILWFLMWLMKYRLPIWGPVWIRCPNWTSK